MGRGRRKVTARFQHLPDPWKLLRAFCLDGEYAVGLDFDWAEQPKPSAALLPLLHSAVTNGLRRVKQQMKTS